MEQYVIGNYHFLVRDFHTTLHKKKDRHKELKQEPQTFHKTSSCKTHIRESLHVNKVPGDENFGR